jgi:hypothetical protein
LTGLLCSGTVRDVTDAELLAAMTDVLERMVAAGELELASRHDVAPLAQTLLDVVERSDGVDLERWLLERDAVVELRDRGDFGGLPLCADAFFVVEEFDGLWGWPAYEERRRLGRLRTGRSGGATRSPAR